MRSTRRSPLCLLTILMALSLVAAGCGSADSAATDTTSDEEVAEAEVAEAEATEAEATEAEEPEQEAQEAETAEDSADAVDEEPEEAEDAGEDVQSGDELTLRSDVILSAMWSDNTTITIDGDMATFASDGLPSHEFLETYLGDGQDGKFIAGGVESYDANFSFPIVPTAADSAQDTPNGAIGVAISGAVFFNPFEGDGTGTVANDDNSTIDGIPFIDACGGHPLPNGLSYHYHGVPFCITDAVDTDGQHSEIIGFLFDGYAIYGPQDVDGELPTDLDECMGHVGPTPDFEEDTYHYHVSTEANYISACFNGVATETRRGR